MIKLLIETLVSIDSRLDNIESTMVKLTEKINDVAAVVSNPSGFVTFAGKVETTVDELKKKMDQGGLMELQLMSMDVQFSQAAYFGNRLENNPDLEELLSEAAIENIKRTHESAKKLQELVGKCQMLTLEAEVSQAAAKHITELDINRMFERRVNEVEKRIGSKNKELEVNNEKLENGLKKIELGCKKAEALNARLSNQATVTTTPSSFVTKRRR